MEAMRRRRGEDERLLAYKDGRSWRRPPPTWSTTTCGRATGLDATAKDFRTWHATVLAAAALAETDEPGETKASRKRAVSGAMKEVAEFLGNTPTLARSSYVDPRVIDAYERGRTIHGTTRRRYDNPDERQAALERATLRLMQGELSHGDHRRRGRHHRGSRSTRWSTPPTTGCGAVAASTVPSTEQVAPRCWRTASSASPTAWPRATPAGPRPATYPPGG